MSDSHTSRDLFHLVVFAYPRGRQLADGSTSMPGHIFVGFYRTYQKERVNGHSPKKGFWNLGWSGDLNEEHHLKDYQHHVAFELTQEKFEAALKVKRNYYIIGVNDCVTYVNRVCDVAGLNTPSVANFILTPIAYYDYIKANNKADPTFILNQQR